MMRAIRRAAAALACAVALCGAAAAQRTPDVNVTVLPPKKPANNAKPTPPPNAKPLEKALEGEEREKYLKEQAEKHRQEMMRQLASDAARPLGTYYRAMGTCYSYGNRGDGISFDSHYSWVWQAEVRVSRDDAQKDLDGALSSGTWNWTNPYNPREWTSQSCAGQVATFQNDTHPRQPQRPDSPPPAAGRRP